ncbi:hypothetical protein BXZ70DRAFT_909533 [Cristinia sonorae]|uniref:Uncharacterized protein n=1 Tax=Cristinia sonorae TaxID=1940300 RepID=A0A8K0UHV9_9AGAR|nr:hypothetical protein BXZ70DRAFT_909533 [Cristinia sonorae]
MSCFRLVPPSRKKNVILDIIVSFSHFSPHGVEYSALMSVVRCRFRMVSVESRDDYDTWPIPSRECAHSRRMKTGDSIFTSKTYSVCNEVQCSASVGPPVSSRIPNAVLITANRLRWFTQGSSTEPHFSMGRSLTPVASLKAACALEGVLQLSCGCKTVIGNSTKRQLPSHLNATSEHVDGRSGRQMKGRDANDEKDSRWMCKRREKRFRFEVVREIDKTSGGKKEEGMGQGGRERILRGSTMPRESLVSVCPTWQDTTFMGHLIGTRSLTKAKRWQLEHSNAVLRRNGRKVAAVATVFSCLVCGLKPTWVGALPGLLWRSRHVDELGQRTTRRRRGLKTRFHSSSEDDQAQGGYLG